MFTDIVGYTALVKEDEQAAFELLKKTRGIHKAIIEELNGKWLKEIGDGVLASFNTVSEAVSCAKRIQQACAREEDLLLRIGIHQGEVVFEGDDVFGNGVNIASQLEAQAQPGEILFSETVYQDLKNKPGIYAEFKATKRLKNVDQPVKIYRLASELKIRK